MHSTHLFLMDWTSVTRVCGGMAFHSCWRNWNSWARFSAGWWLSWTRQPRMSQRFSMGAKSGEWAGQSTWVTWCCWRKPVTTLVWWCVALASWRIMPDPIACSIGRTMCNTISFLYPMPVMYVNTSIHKPFSWMLPHAFSGIVVGQSAVEFICEQHPIPLLPCAVLLMSAPCPTSLTMGWGQWQADNRYPWSKVKLMQTIPNSLLADAEVSCPSHLLPQPCGIGCPLT